MNTKGKALKNKVNVDRKKSMNSFKEASTKANVKSYERHGAKVHQKEQHSRMFKRISKREFRNKTY